MTDFFARHPNAAASETPPAHWPGGVRHLSLDGLEHLGVDGAGRLYVDGVRIATVNEFRLTKWQAWIAGGAAVLASLATVATAILDAFRFFGYSSP